MSFPLKLHKLEIVPLSRDPGKLLIRWELLPTKVNLTDFEFYIDSGDSPNQIQGFQDVTIDGQPVDHVPRGTNSVNQYQIAGPISALDFYQYVDYTPRLKNLQNNIYYRLRIRRISTQEEIGSDSVTWQGDLDLVGLYIIEEHNFLLEDAIGVPCLIHIRKRGGIPCSGCFDPIQKKRTVSHCQRCYGTNWEGGFYKPIDAFIDFSPSPKNTVIKQWGETQPNETDVLIANYPEVSNGDLIRELRENKIWRVVKSRQTEKRRTPMLQFVRVIEINPGDVEYKLRYDDGLALSKINQFEEIRNLREF